MSVNRTIFRPETDGFLFKNTWHYDAVEKATLEQIVGAGVTVLEGALAPIIMALLGPVIVAEAAVCGPFALVCIDETVKDINNETVSAITGAIDAQPYGLCGGMAFASLDYWLKRWMVPQGNGDPGDQPTRDTPQGEQLRSYLWRRLLKSVEDNAGTFLTWMGALLLPGAPGAAWLRDRTVEQWNLLKSKIDATGQPVPIGLVGTTANPFNNHQVLAYGYEDTGGNTGKLFLYDNNNPKYESVTTIDLSGAILEAHEDASDPGRGPLQGFFCTNYSQAIPPLSVGLRKGVRVSPDCVEAGLPVTATFTVGNVGYERSTSMKLLTGTSAALFAEEPAFTSLAQGADRSVHATLDPITAGTITVHAAADLGSWAGISIIKALPPLDSHQATTATAVVLPHLDVEWSQGGGSPCQSDSRAGVKTQFFVDTSPLGAPTQLSYKGSVTPALPIQGAISPMATVTLPAQVGVTVTMSVRVTLAGGCSTTGSVSVVTISDWSAQMAEILCQISQTKLYKHLFAWQAAPDPGPEGSLIHMDPGYVPTAVDITTVKTFANRLIEVAGRGGAAHGAAESGVRGVLRDDGGSVTEMET